MLWITGQTGTSDENLHCARSVAYGDCTTDSEPYGRHVITRILRTSTCLISLRRFLSFETLNQSPIYQTPKFTGDTVKKANNKSVTLQDYVILFYSLKICQALATAARAIVFS